VSSLLAQAWRNTAVLAAAAAGFGLVVGVLLGAIAAVFRGRLLDRALSVATLTGLSVPSFWAAIILLIVFSVNLGVLPASGMGTGGGVDLVRHLVLPVIAASLVTTSITARVTRASMVEMFSSDFVDTLRAKGLRGGRVLWHVAKNALGPILTTAGLQFGYLLGGSVLIETIFRWPGMGTLVFNAISARDLLVVQGAILVIAVVFVLINLVVDVVQVAIDPRLKRAMG
jgi:peptide/nickel transport system permease protein